MKIIANNISKSYSGEDLFKNLSFEVGSGCRLSIAGPNGCGKSTLLMMLAGLIEPDAGSISRSKGLKTGYVSQDLDSRDLKTGLLEYVLSVLPDWSDFWAEWNTAEAEGDNKKLTRLSRKQAELELNCGYNPEYKAKAILSGLGFNSDELNAPLEVLSGGWRERAKLSRTLLQGADVLIMDEPTNHLDMDAVLWLENYLLNFNGILFLVAHDRFFLDKVSTHFLYLGLNKPCFRPGNYSKFLEWHEERENLKEKQRGKISQEIDHLTGFVNRFRYKATKAAQAQSRLSRIRKLSESMHELEAEGYSRGLSFSWPEPKKASKVAITCEDLSFAHPGKPGLINDLSFQLFNGQKVALMGPNGCGKSTLLKLIAGNLFPEKGHAKLGQNTCAAYFSQHQADTLVLENSVLDEIRRLSSEELTEEETRSVLGLFMLGESFWGRKVKSLSGGEKSRLILSTLFLTRANLLLLDEPTNHLDMESREGLVAALKDYRGAIFMVAHDRYLLSQTADEIWTLEKGKIVQQNMDFEQYYRKVLLGEINHASDDQGFVKDKVMNIYKKKKKQQALLRNSIYQQLVPLKHEFKKMEDRLEKCLQRQDEVESALSRSETYQEPDLIKDLNLEYRDLTAENERLLLLLEKLENEILAIEARKSSQADSDL